MTAYYGQQKTLADHPESTTWCTTTYIFLVQTLIINIMHCSRPDSCIHNKYSQQTFQLLGESANKLLCNLLKRLSVTYNFNTILPLWQIIVHSFSFKYKSSHVMIHEEINIIFLNIPGCIRSTVTRMHIPKNKYVFFFLNLDFTFILWFIHINYGNVQLLLAPRNLNMCDRNKYITVLILSYVEEVKIFILLVINLIQISYRW